MLNILLVDPSAADTAILASALRAEGFEVVTRATARAAREVLERRPIALTILELMIRSPGVSGLDLARNLRTAYPAMRVLLTSSYHLSERQLERADCGVSGFIPKPYDLREVVDFVSAKTSAPPSSRRIWCLDEEPRSGVSARLAPVDGDLASSS